MAYFRMTYHRFRVLAFLMVVGGLVAFMAKPVLAQIDSTAAAVVTSSSSFLEQIVPPAITLIVPLVIIVIKKMASKYLGSVPLWLKHILPIISPLLGLLVGWLQSLITGVSTSPITDAISGALGTWIREVIDQLKKFGSTDEAAITSGT